MVAVDLLKIVQDLKPIILRHAATAEINRKMAPEVMSALIDTDLFKMWIPRTLGGLSQMAQWRSPSSLPH